MYKDIKSKQLEESWNTYFQNLHSEVCSVLIATGIRLLFADPFYCDVRDYFNNDDDIKNFNTSLNDKFHLDLPLDSTYSFWEIEVEIATRDMLKLINKEQFLDKIDFTQFKEMFSQEEELKNEIRKTIESGCISYLGKFDSKKIEEYSFIEFTSDNVINGKRIVFIVKAKELGCSYEITEVYTVDD